MRTVAITCAALASCGRIDFDARSDAGGSVSRCTPSAEVCDGVDNDCDDRVDDGCPCVAFDNETPGYPISSPGFAWTGRGYLSITYDRPSDYVGVVAVSSTGTFGPVTPLFTDQGIVKGRDTLAWTGSRGVVVYVDPSTQLVMLDWVDADGTRLETTSIAGSLASFARIAWGGDRLVVLWQHFATSETRYAELAADGTLLGLPAIVDGFAGLFVHRLIARPDGFTVSAMGDAETTPWLIFVDRAGTSTVRGLTLNGEFELFYADARDGIAIVHGGTPGELETRTIGGAPLAGPFPLPDATGLSVVPDIAARETGFRVFTFTQASGTSIEAAAHDLALDGTFANMRPLGTVTFGIFSGPSAISAAGRTAVVFTYEDATPHHRVIQLCD